MNEQELKQILASLAEQGVPETVAGWPAVQARLGLMKAQPPHSRLKGGFIMSKSMALAAIAIMIVALGLLAVVPAVSAYVGKIIGIPTNLSPEELEKLGIRVMDKKEMEKQGISLPQPQAPPLRPTHMPISEAMTGISAKPGDPAHTTSLTYMNGQQFIALIQSDAPAEGTLPEGEKVTIKGQPATLVRGLAGKFNGMPLYPDHEVEVLGGGEGPSLISYENGTRLVWNVGSVRVELLSNLPEAEILKVAESLEPNE